MSDEEIIKSLRGQLFRLIGDLGQAAGYLEGVAENFPAEVKDKINQKAKAFFESAQNVEMHYEHR